MPRRRSRRDTGLLSLALGSGWPFSASLAVGALVLGVGVLPSMLAENKFLVGLVPMVRVIAWGVALVFGMIALIKAVTQASRRAAEPARWRDPEPGVGVAPSAPAPERAEPTLLDAAWEASMAPERPADVARPAVWSQEILEQVEWKRFEDLCCAFFKEKGITAEVTPLGPDGGIDIALHQDPVDPVRVTAIVQCKAWNQAVGIKPVRELRGVMAHKQVDKAFFMAPQGFTSDAQAFAREGRITLLDGKLFLAMIRRLPEAAQHRLLALTTAGDWTTPTCPNCGRTMVTRHGRGGDFWGCPGFPRCRGKLKKRGQRPRD